MNIFKAAACSVVVAFALGVAGCGGSDDDSSDDSITKTEFVAQANAICAESNTAIESAESEAFSGNQQPTDADIEAFVNDTVIPQVDEQLTSIEELGAPEGEEDQVNEILDAANQALDEAKTDPASLAGNADPFADANKLAAAYGLNECAG
ncbi:MAG: hypothetical protein ACSLFI_13120 [Solirubrobacterales bacterium]